MGYRGLFSQPVTFHVLLHLDGLEVFVEEGAEGGFDVVEQGVFSFGGLRDGGIAEVQREAFQLAEGGDFFADHAVEHVFEAEEEVGVVALAVEEGHLVEEVHADPGEVALDLVRQGFVHLPDDVGGHPPDQRGRQGLAPPLQFF